jgi:predicted kinase
MMGATTLHKSPQSTLLIVLSDLRNVFISKNTLVVLCGPAGCGKSTFAAKHFLKTQVVSSDECRALISDDATNQGVSGHAFDLMHFIIEKRLRLGRLSVADATNLKRENRKALQKIAGWYQFNTAVIIFNLPLEVCLARNAARARVVPEDALVAQYELLARTIDRIDSEGFDYVYVLDETAQAEATVTIGRGVNPRSAQQAPGPR